MKTTWKLGFLAGIALLALVTSCERAPNTSTSPEKIRFSVAPFQDTLLPVVGAKKGWYKEEDLNVEIIPIDWYSTQESLASGHIDVGMGNIASVIGAHHNFPDSRILFLFNTFDNGFAIMIRPNSGMKTAAQLEHELGSPEKAATAAIRQLRGKSVITTGQTDMEQVVAYAVRAAGMELGKDVKVIDLEPDEGLSAYLHGTGDAYLGGIPQRTRALKQGSVELLSGSSLGPSEINGIVSTGKFVQQHQEDILKLIHVIFRTVDYTNKHLDEVAAIIVGEMKKNDFTVDDFKRYWNNYEHYVSSPAEARQRILAPESPTYWKRRWDDSNYYFLHLKDEKRRIPSAVDASGVFLMPQILDSYVRKYGE